MKSNEVVFWIWLAEALGVGNRDFRTLLALYESPYHIFSAESEELEQIGRLSQKSIAALSNKDLARASEILDRCERLGIGILPYSAEIFPAGLREIKDPPVLLYYVGTVPRLDKLLSIAIVGTRRMSAYGMESAYRISYELTEAGAVTVSGMAEGIDGVSAAATIKAGGSPIAVLGCGLDIAYPKHHGKLMQEIARQGLLLSEYPPGTRPVRYHFPERNRIISGLSNGVVVVEAGLGSGSLITAKHAIVQGREVFAIPAGAEGVAADGATGLLRDGAIFAMDAGDILNRYRYLFCDSLKEIGAADQKKNTDPDLAYLRELGVIKNENEGRNAQRKAAPKRSEAAVKRSSPKTHTKEDDPPKSAPRQSVPDEVLQGLDPLQRLLLESIPDDGAVTVDSLTGLGYPYGQIVSALTMLEIEGLLEKLPGALYKKA